MTNANPNHYFFSVGSKRKESSAALIDQITRLFGNFEALTQPDSTPISIIYANKAFDYKTITVERPERDGSGHIVLGSTGTREQFASSPSLSQSAAKRHHGVLRRARIRELAGFKFTGGAQEAC